MCRKFSLLLAAIGVVAFAVSLTYRYLTSAPTPPVAEAPIAEAPIAEPVVEEETIDVNSLLDAYDEELPPKLAEDLESADFKELFDDEPDPTVQDELLKIEQGDSSRYITEQDRMDSALRQQRARTASLNASSHAGDDRLQMIGILGAYAGEGNSDAAAELRRVLQSTDGELRADALEAIAELLPANDAVPSYSEEPLSDSEVARLIQALQDGESS